jgi:Cu-processing system permease protein
MMVDFPNVTLLAMKELRDASRNKWLTLYTVAFAGLSLSLAWMALSGAGRYGLAGFGQTAASLINLVLLIVPLMGLTLGAMSMSAERERGTLAYLMAQPISHAELLFGKFLGLALALLAALTIGFGVTALAITFNGGGAQAGTFLALMLLSYLLAVVSLSIGLLLSVAVRQTATAVGLALFLWLVLVFFGDLGIMGSALVMRMDAPQLLGLTMINPLQLFKISAIMAIRDNLELLGPAGVFASRTFGNGLLPLFGGVLVAWIAACYAATAFLFRRRGVL